MSGGRRQSVVDRNSGSPRGGLGDEAMICRHSGACASYQGAEAEWTSPRILFPQQGWRSLTKTGLKSQSLLRRLLYTHALAVLLVIARQQRGENLAKRKPSVIGALDRPIAGSILNALDIKGEGRSRDDVANEQGDTIGRPHPNQKGIVVSSP